MGHASVWEGHNRKQQTKREGRDSKGSSRFQEEQAVPHSLSSVCVCAHTCVVCICVCVHALGVGSRKRWYLGGQSTQSLGRGGGGWLPI